MIIGEAMGQQELEDGCLPFRPFAQSGALLERAIRRCGYTRDMFVLYNAIPTHPPNNNLKGHERDAIEWGKPFVEDVIRRFRPRAIVAVGGISIRATTGLSGRHLGVTHLAGFTLPSTYGIPVIPAFHPSFMRRGKIGYLGTFMRALRAAVSIARSGERPVEPPFDSPPAGYLLYPTEAQALAYLEQCKGAPFISYDIETFYSTNEEEAEEDTDELGTDIRSIQFSHSAGSGIYLPWRAPFIPIAKAILSLPNAKLSWNGWRFDEPVLAHNGAMVAGENHDLMWAWHHTQPDLPRGLQFAAAQLGWPYPWKHLDSANPQFYGIVDVDVLHYMRPRIFDALSKQGILSTYKRHIVEFEQVLRRMSERGMPIDLDEFKKVQERLRSDRNTALAAMQTFVPPELIKRKVFKREPKQKVTKQGVTEFNTATGMWERSQVWKPSKQALTRYMRNAGHPVPKAIKSKEDTTNALELERLYRATKDPLYEKVLQYRKASTILTNHMENWTPGPDSRVHPVFYFSPATGQLSSRRPNAQNAPTHGEYALLFRRIVKARPQHTILEFDFKSFHVQTLAFEAEDEVMSRMGRMDIHSFTTACFMKLNTPERIVEMQDGELKEYLGWVKKNHKHTRDAKAKHALLGYNNGMGYRKLYLQYREFYENEREAKKFMQLLDHIFPKSKLYRDAIVRQAHEQGFLISKHGFIRYFFEVFKNVGGRWSHGDDHEAALCFFTQNDAHGELRDRMLVVEQRGLSARYNMLDTIHDSILFECHNDLVVECKHEVKTILEAPSTVLRNKLWPNGLSVEVDIGEGADWAIAKGLK
jgi:uracil-DNA glycosylase family 4